MHPVLFEIGSLKIHTYGVMSAIGFLLAVFIVQRLAKKEGLRQDKMIDLAFWCLIVGFAGTRVVYVLTRLDFFLAEPAAVFRVWEGGLVWYGGPMAAIPFGLWYVKRNGIPPWKALDIIITGMVAGHMSGRFGCFGAGCCYGKPTDSFIGVKFHSDLVDEALRGVLVYPTQLFSAFSLMILLLGLFWVHKHKKFDGQVFLTYIMAYPLIRSVIEAFRGDKIRGFIVQDVLSTSQFISILVFCAGATVLYIRLKQVRGEIES